MPRDFRLYLDDILESCGKIREFTEGMSFEEFERDVKTQDAVFRNFEVIGEAANRLPEAIKSQVQWSRMAENHWISQYTDPRVFWCQTTDGLDGNPRENPSS